MSGFDCSLTFRNHFSGKFQNFASFVEIGMQALHYILHTLDASRILSLYIRLSICYILSQGFVADLIYTADYLLPLLLYISLAFAFVYKTEPFSFAFGVDRVDREYIPPVLRSLGTTDTLAMLSVAVGFGDWVGELCLC